MYVSNLSDNSMNQVMRTGDQRGQKVLINY